MASGGASATDGVTSPDSAVPADPAPDSALSRSDVVVRRRRMLMAAAAVASSALAAGYLVRFSATGSPTSATVGIALIVIAVCFGYAWTDARVPLLIADATGLRIRLGSAWTGVPWELVDTVTVEERGSLRDGQVTVGTLAGADVLAGANRRTRWAAWLNRWLYDAPLVVPFGLTTSVSVADLTGSLETLSAGRAAVVVLNGPEPEPEVTVELSFPRAAVDPDPAQATAPADERATVAAAERAAAPADERATAPADVTPDAAPELLRPRRRHWISLAPSRFGAPRTSVGDYASTPARREDVTIAARSGGATAGSLALSEPVARASQTLPEILQLRRPAEPDLGRRDGSAGVDTAAGTNVSLIIDATTDLTARAMQRVRTSPTVQVGAATARPSRPELDVPMSGTVIGGRLTEARTTLGLSIDELAERTRIRPYVIESIEVDDFSPCGGDFYARGHLRMLARVLGVDGGPLIEAYDERFATTPVNARKVFEVELATGSTGMVRGGASGANWGALIAAVLVLLLIWGVARYVTGNVGPAAAHHSAQHAHHRSGQVSPQPPAHVRPAQAQVKLTATGGSRVKVLDGRGKVLFTGVLAAGGVQKVKGRAPLRVHAADAGAVRLSVRGKPLGPVGAAGVPGHRLVPAATTDGTLAGTARRGAASNGAAGLGSSSG